METNNSYSLRDDLRSSRRRCQSSFRSGLLLVLIGILVTACTPAQSKDPVSIVQGMIDHINQSDLDGLMEFYADNAVMCSPGGCFHGAQEIRTKYEDYLTLGRRLELSDVSSEGNAVSFTLKGYKGDLIAETAMDGLDIVKDGKIIFDGTKAFLQKECDRDPSQAFCP